MQAVLILAHNNYKQLLHLSKIMSESFKVYIHIDRKWKLTDEQFNTLNQNNIKTISEINVNWGGWSISAATLLLLKLALKNHQIDYIHIISGEDWPVIKPSEIYDYYDGNDNIYLLSKLAKETIKSRENCLNWQKYYFNYDRVNRRTILGKIYHRILYYTQFILRIDKLKKLNINEDIFQGPNWMDLPRDAAEYIVNFFETHKNYQRLFMTGYCSDEFWIQTILMNSIYKERIVQDYHRFILWENKNGSYPAILDIEDLEKIKAGNYHFMRKVKLDISKELLDRFCF